MAMMMGDILAAARDRSHLVADWLYADPELAAAVKEAAQREGATPNEFVRGVVAGFSHSASEEDWARLMSKLRDSDDPGTTCLVVMLRWRFAMAEPASR